MVMSERKSGTIGYRRRPRSTMRTSERGMSDFAPAPAPDADRLTPPTLIDAETVPSSPPPNDPLGYCSISSAANLVYTPLTTASPAPTGFESPSAIMSPASTARENENVSPGTPRTAIGSAPALGSAGAPAAGDQVWVIVSGLNWKTMTFGSDPMNVGMNETNAPFMYLPAIALSLAG